jgi:Domain of unknown function (DUF1905)/Bacteriocin-protection, YdeI or OmpD-Associated
MAQLGAQVFYGGASAQTLTTSWRFRVSSFGASNTMSKVRFRSVMEINNVNPYVPVSAHRAARLRKGWRKPLPVRVRVNGKPEKAWRINMMPMGDGSFYLYLHADVRKASNTKVGQVVSVELEYDDKYRSGPAHPMPVWFRNALGRNRKATQAWDALIPSRKKEILRYFSRLKSPEAEARNLRRAMEVLSGGKERFMGRFWTNGR